MKYAINLFPSRRSVFDVLTNFMVYYLRYALVIALFFVVVTFFLRMPLDEQLVNEQQKMSQKKAIVAATEGIRGDLQKVQQKVKDINSVLTGQDLIIAQINYVAAILPSSVTVSTLDISDKGVNVTATTPEYKHIQGLQKRLQTEARFEKIAFGDITRDTKGVYTITITLADWKQKKTS